MLFQSIAHVLAEPLVDELVVVDNGSTSEDAARLRRNRRDRTASSPAAGTRQHRLRPRLQSRRPTPPQGRRLVILNPDACLQPGCIAALIEGAKGFASPCVVGARVLNTDGSEQRGARRGEVTPLTTLLSLSHLARVVPALHRFEIHKDDEPAPDGPVATPTISGSCFYMSRADFDAIGGFDEGYFLHVEDIDLCWRARRAGGSVVFQPSAVVLHEGSTSQSLKIKVEFHKARGLIRYFLKRADNPGSVLLALAISPAILAASLVRPLMRGVFGPVRGRLS